MCNLLCQTESHSYLCVSAKNEAAVHAGHMNGSRVECISNSQLRARYPDGLPLAQPLSKLALIQRSMSLILHRDGSSDLWKSGQGQDAVLRLQSIDVG